ncbi:hypothetical protein PV11_06351 [Exophiala sideris]|uniref:Uncharacterized protein n=1 Tax=Exophiala sideris TaxID=1016849 RepID=A0A0D1VRN5_9EURO|nr:hypothetical protein PV11_06351 [Exophiala sideris]
MGPRNRKKAARDRQATNDFFNNAHLNTTSPTISTAPLPGETAPLPGETATASNQATRSASQARDTSSNFPAASSSSNVPVASSSSQIVTRPRSLAQPPLPPVRTDYYLFAPYDISQEVKDQFLAKLLEYGEYVLDQYKKDRRETERNLIIQFQYTYGRKVKGKRALEWHVDLEIIKQVAEGILSGRLIGLWATGAESDGTPAEDIVVTAPEQLGDYEAASFVVGYFLESAVKIEKGLYPPADPNKHPAYLPLITIGLIKFSTLLKQLSERPEKPGDRVHWRDYYHSRLESMDTQENLHVPGAIANMDGTSLTKGLYDEEENLDIGSLNITDSAAGPSTNAAAPGEGKKKKRKNRKRGKRKNKGKGKAQPTDTAASDVSDEDEPDIPEPGVAEPVGVVEPVDSGPDVPEPKGKGKGKARAEDLPAYIPGPNTPSVPDMPGAFGPGPAVPSAPEDNGEGPSTRAAAAPPPAAVDPITLVPDPDAGLEQRRRPLTKKAANDRIIQHLTKIHNAPYKNKEARRAALARARQQIMQSETLAAARGEQPLRPTAPRARAAPAPEHVPSRFQFGTLPGWEGELEAMMVEGMRKKKEPEPKK